MKKIVQTSLHLCILVFLLAPLVVVLLVSFTPTLYMDIPVREFSLRWYSSLASNSEFLAAIRNSAIFAAVSSLLAVAISVPAAIALARQRFPGSGGIRSFLLSPMMVPSVVLGIAFLKYLSTIGLASTMTGLVICHCIIVTPYVLRLTMAAVGGINRNAELAATSLGASNFTVFRRVTLPLVLPGVVSGAVIAFVTSFDEVTVTVFVASPGTMTIPVKLLNHITETTDPLAASASALLIFLAAAVMLLVERYFGLQNIFSGKVK
ncbi:ABC transporter permease [Bordetella genomosp. 5]|uniref:ABC transporter permease n=1 Tax=Bordetella genomosp. 5 TaxID=1395608 RepID=A0A261TWG1_9BORD|nr:ABC transporter permease [Bordetella genomosp. 5]OZI53631.1 ABC transporter permease [Bordetella genomosp. 5]